jgi:serine O-acetyltransferase
MINYWYEKEVSSMKLNEWLDCEASIIARKLEEQNRDYYFKDKTLGFASKENILQALQHLRSALFPGVYDKFPIDEDKTGVIIGNHIRAAAMDLDELVKQALDNHCIKAEKGTQICSKCIDRANEITLELLQKLPDIREILHTDIQAAYTGDPAAQSAEEILLCYPSIEALSVHRIAHALYKAGVPLLPRAMSEYAHQITGIDIHPGATIGRHFFIDHGTGVVIGETCTIGEHVKLFMGVTLGAKSFQLDDQGNPVKGIKRHPDIEDNVIIYSNATILGGDTRIGHDSIIGGNVWLTHSVPPYSKVYNSQPQPVIKNGDEGDK